MMEAPRTHTQVPVNVGTSVMAIKYADGVMLAADTAVAYGSMKKTKHSQRMAEISEETIIACSGEMSDFQELIKIFREKHEHDVIENDGAQFFKPKDYFNYLSRVNYQRRMKMDPLWNGTLVGGVRKDTGEVFLGSVDLYGTKVEGNFFATGLASHYCQVLMQNAWKPELTEQEARKLLEECMRVMFYRDKKATDEIQIAKVTKAGT
jgi:20S proteasome subunit beta 7